ncbi:haloacid dehalogenase [Marivivens niveibacter]|uniref:phosphoglycolate phosphatase n=1 Tax=Marivivens niveibacter TaxID=1930667 RepID=A0A251WW45_9RHOB|nr:HAD-IA family hydrolase [Marivivens niveibacter]OUD08710.1 haloacid dehalogenase [Marivivens niveibacter]
MRTVIFDLDGTLADTSVDLINAANSCFRSLGLGEVLDPVADAAVAVRGGRMMLTTGFDRVGWEDAAEIDRQYPHLLSAYEQDVATHTYLYDGAMDAVETLKTNGFAVGICTNKPEKLARMVLSQLGVLDAFGSLIGADTLPVRKPDPEPLVQAALRAGGNPERCLLVGDSVTDLNTSRALGVPSVMVGFGPAGNAVADLQPDAIIQHFNDLPDVAHSLLG